MVRDGWYMAARYAANPGDHVAIIASNSNHYVGSFDYPLLRSVLGCRSGQLMWQTLNQKAGVLERDTICIYWLVTTGQAHLYQHIHKMMLDNS